MKDDRIYLSHIVDCLQTILDHTDGMDKAGFLADRKTQDACIRQFEVMGEATKRLSESFRQRFHQIQWRQLARMRDKLIHDYFDIDLEIIWRTVVEDVIPTLSYIMAINHQLNLENSDLSQPENKL